MATVSNNTKGNKFHDEKNGQFISKDTNSQTGLEQHHEGSGLSDQNIVDDILSGQYGQDLADYYNDNPSEREALIEYIHSEIDSANTENKKNERFTPLSTQEYYDFQQNSMMNSGLSNQEISVIHRYIGTGSTSFYLNTAMRIGYDEMLKQFIKREGYDPNTIPGDYLSRDNFNEFKTVMEKATHSSQAPRNMRVDRYIGTGPLVSWLKNTNILSGLQTESNGFHEHLTPGTYNIQDLADRLSSLIGSVMPRDGSFLSFSAAPDKSHMKHKQGSGTKKAKDVLLKIDVEKGQDMLITSNTHESEGMFPSDTDFYVKDVKVERNDSTGKDMVVMYYGIKRKTKH